MTDIHLFKPYYRTDEVLAEIRQCLDSGWTGLGGTTIEFEDAWKRYAGVPHAHFTNSCTAALHLAVRCLKDKYGWQDGNEVITTPISFVSTNHVLLHEGLKPVFADVDQYLCLDPESVERRITSKTRAVMFVGLGGNTGQLLEVCEVALRNRLRFIVDAAHMAGTRLENHRGWIKEADATCFSFQAIKNLSAADGGMVCFFQDDDHGAGLDRKARQLSWLGIDKDTYSRTTHGGAYKWKYDVPGIGWKYYGNAIAAAIGLVSLRYLDRDNAYRRQIALWYDSLLDGIDKVPVAPDCESSRHLYQILVDNRDSVMLALNAQGIFPGVHYGINTDYPMYSYAKGTCPNAERLSNQVLSLPMHLGLTYDDVRRVAQAIREIV